MARARALVSAAMTRRSFVGGVAAVAAGAWAGRYAAGRSSRPERGAPPALVPGEPALVLRVPPFTANGERVPIVVESDHAMTAQHHVTRVRIVNEADPISSKGTFHFTPANGRVHLSFQARMHEGRSVVAARAECSEGRASAAEGPLEIPGGGGG